MVHLQKFIAGGGLFIPITVTSSLPIDYGITTGVSIQAPVQLRAQGSIFNASFADRKSPIAYGYDENLAVYFNSTPLFAVGGFGGGGQFGGAAATGGRVSGRGTITDGDVVQGMPRASLPENARPGGDNTDNPNAPPPVPVAMRPRVVLRFAADEKNLLISGMLAGGSELAGKPAVLDVPVGQGHVVMFATNPMWRHQTQGEFFLIFNAALNFNNLGAGRVETPARPAPTSDEDEN
jgi:hypothetical protein